MCILRSPSNYSAVSHLVKKSADFPNLRCAKRSHAPSGRAALRIRSSLKPPADENQKAQFDYLSDYLQNSPVTRAIVSTVDAVPLFWTTNPWLSDRAAEPILENLDDYSDDMVPMYRGASHQAAFYVSCVLGCSLVSLAAMEANNTVLPAIIFSLSNTLMFLTSGTLHRGPAMFRSLAAPRSDWPKKKSEILVKIDHSMIFINVVGIACGFGYIIASGPVRGELLSVGGAGIIIGTTLEWLFTDEIPKWLDSALYFTLGLALFMLVLPAVIAKMSPQDLELLVTGLGLLIVGAGVYGCQSPSPWPKHFGYHEVFHMLHIAGVATFYSLMFDLVLVSS